MRLFGWSTLLAERPLVVRVVVALLWVAACFAVGYGLEQLLGLHGCAICS